MNVSQVAIIVPTMCLALTIGGLAGAEEPASSVARAVQDVDQVVASGPFEPTWRSLESYEIPEWYQDAKFGIFIHWGVYSVPAFDSEWYPRRMYVDTDKIFAHHVEKWGPQSEFGYKDFIPLFRAEKFDASQWARLFRDCGAKYVIPVAEHHDGFPLYECSFTEWDSTKMGPKRDIIAELADAVRAEGMRLGVSSHRAFNWAFYLRDEKFDTTDPAYEGLYGVDLPFLHEEDAKDHTSPWQPHSEEFKDDWLARTAELVDKYQPDIVWFDFGIGRERAEDAYKRNPFADHLKRFAAYYYNHAAARGGEAIINYKWEAFSPKSAVLDLERSKMEGIRHPFWQTDTAVSSSSWGYTENQQYKKPNRLIDDLVDIVSKNGCLLLNVGPRADGTIPEEDQRILLEIGSWLKVNGEAIYETRPWKTFGEGPTGTVTGHISEHKNKPFTPADIRFTAKGDTLYAIGLGWPDEPSVSIKSLGTDAGLLDRKITGVSLLGSSESISWDLTADGLSVELPASRPTEHAYALKIETAAP